MSNRLPTRLVSEPIIEAVSEVRFDAAGEAAVNLLPGIFHEKFGPFDQQGRVFPVLPSEIMSSDPSLAFRPQVAMAKGNRIIQVGAKVVSVAVRAPYPGWKEFSAFIRQVYDVVCAQSFITTYDWLSLKYVDMVTFDGETPSLSWLNAEVELGGTRVEEQPVSLRVESVEGPVTTVVNIGSPVQTQQLDRSARTGVLLDVDTIHREPFAEFASQYSDVLEKLHDRNKQQFFSLLSESTRDRLGPEYA